MSICIYCLRDLPSEAFTTEHVIPRALGTFRNNLTLPDCVCGDCNHFYSVQLEPILAEGTFEAVRRLEYRVKSPESAKYLRKDRVVITLSGGKWDGLRVELQGEGDHFVVVPLPQVRLAKRDGTGWLSVIERDLAGIQKSFLEQVNTKRLELMYDSDDTKQRLIQALAEHSIEFLEQESGYLSPEAQKESLVTIQTVIDDIVLRCMAKIAFNYLAKTAGSDFVLKEDFNPIRSYIRYGTRPSYDFHRVDDRPILLNDSLMYRQTIGHLVTVNWPPDGRDIVSQVSPFNHRTYHFRLSYSYSGVWRSIKSGHHFDIKSRRISLLAGSSSVQIPPGPFYPC